jgi:hypothetical protein
VSLPPTALGSGAAIIAGVTRIALVADDLIWASRLTDAVRRAGAEPRRVSPAAVLAGDGGDLDNGGHDPQARVAARPASATEGCDGAIVDTALMTADPMVVIAALHDLGLRKRALAAGAGKVLAYRKLHDDGPATIAAWIESRPTQTRGVTVR